MKAFISIFFVLVLSSCNTIEIKEVPLKKPILNIDLPELKFERVEIYKINDTYMMNENDYKRLLMNNELIYNYIFQINEIIKMYKEYYEK